jgi:hypothetical protein
VLRESPILAGLAAGLAAFAIVLKAWMVDHRASPARWLGSGPNASTGPELTLPVDGYPMCVKASPETVRFIETKGAMLFISPERSIGGRCVLTWLKTALDPPPEALQFRRLVLPSFFLYLHPSFQGLPRELVLGLRGRRRPRVVAYWNGFAFVM